MPPMTLKAPGPTYRRGLHRRPAPGGSEPPSTPTRTCLVLMGSPLRRGPQLHLLCLFLAPLSTCLPPAHFSLSSCIHVALSHSVYGRRRGSHVLRVFTWLSFLPSSQESILSQVYSHTMNYPLCSGSQRLLGDSQRIEGACIGTLIAFGAVQKWSDIFRFRLSHL